MCVGLYSLELLYLAQYLFALFPTVFLKFKLKTLLVEVSKHQEGPLNKMRKQRKREKRELATFVRINILNVPRVNKP
jgi:hypothetical protein